jgi:hypothetical protein
VLWKFAQRDRDAIRDAAFTEHWMMFLRMLKKHGADWEPREYRIAGASEKFPTGKYETRPAPVLDAGFEAAIETTFGRDIKAARKAVIQEHPQFGYAQTNEPGLRASQIEKRVREVWMRQGRP